MCVSLWVGLGKRRALQLKPAPNTHATPTVRQNGSSSNSDEPMRPTLSSSTAQTGGLGDSPEGPKGAGPRAPDMDGRGRYKNLLIWGVLAGIRSGPWSWRWVELRTSVLNGGVDVSGAGLGQGP